MDNPPMKEPESAIPDDQTGPVPLASVLIEVLAAMLARREGREQGKDDARPANLKTEWE
jgi:hypothetical protein